MHIDPKVFTNDLLNKGYSFWTGVPCSSFKSLINYGIDSDQINYFGASSEGEAAGIAMGAYLAGTKPVVMCQNSGLGNMVNPITSLYHPFKIPALFIVSHRGDPDGPKDEPQHQFMGENLPKLLPQLQVGYSYFPNRKDDSFNYTILEMANDEINDGNMFALVTGRNIFKKYNLKNTQIKNRKGSIAFGLFTNPKKRFARVEAISIIKEFVNNKFPLIATTGKTGRELFALGHQPNQFYVVGGMGCASAIGLGVSLTQKKKTFIIDGDGAALMKMGNMATIGSHGNNNLVHIVLDNEAHESTGAQSTVSNNVDFATIAGACGYSRSLRCDTSDELAACLQDVLAVDWQGPVFIHVKVGIKTDPDLGRPTLTPIQIKHQFMEFLKDG